MNLLAVASFLFALFSAPLFTWCVRKLAVVRGWNGPSSPHHVHDGLVPRVGGIAVMGAVQFSLVIGGLISRALSPQQILTLAETMAAAFLVFLVGVWDDFQPIRAVTKLTCESFAGLMLFMAGVRIDHLPVVGPLPPALSLLLTVICVVGITNAFNLIDGLDGLAAGTATASTVVFLFIALYRGDPVTALLAATLLGAVVGFLPFNLNPASIFLGDCGSLFIGFLMSVFAIDTVSHTGSVRQLAVPVLAIGLPILDTLLAIIRRRLKKRSIFVPDREHVHHMLLERGHSHRGAVLFLYGVSGVFGCLSLVLVLRQSMFPLVLVASLATAATTIFVGYLQGTRFAEHVAKPLEIAEADAKHMVLKQAASQLRYVQTFPDLWYTLEAACSAAHLVGYDVCIPGPLAAVDLSRSGFLLDHHDRCYVRRFRNGVASNGARDAVLAVQFSARPKQDGAGELKIYFTRSLEIDRLLPAAFPLALSDAMDRALSVAHKGYGGGQIALDDGRPRPVTGFNSGAPNPATSAD